MELIEVEVWVMVDENGDVAVGQDRDELQPEAGLASRFVRLAVNVPKPKPVELAATVSEESTAGELKAK